jgi:hypothetical protein
VVLLVLLVVPGDWVGCVVGVAGAYSEDLPLLVGGRGSGDAAGLVADGIAS